MFVRAVPGADDGVSKVMSRSGMRGRSGVSARASSAADRDGRYDNAKCYLSSASLSSLVGLSLTLTVGRLPPSLSPGVLWYSTRLCAEPLTCQDGRETAVTSGHPRASGTASDLGTCRLNRCVKHTSKQRVAGVESRRARQVAKLREYCGKRAFAEY